MLVVYLTFSFSKKNIWKIKKKLNYKNTLQHKVAKEIVENVKKIIVKNIFETKQKLLRKSNNIF